MADNTTTPETTNERPYEVTTSNDGSSRWGISALSKENKDIAYPEEIMVNKSTGEFVIKSKDNDKIISYEYNSRLKSHLDTVTMTAYNMGICGKIYLMDIFPNVDMPDNIVKREPYHHIISGMDDNISKIMLSIDMDCLTVIGSSTNIRTNPEIDCVIELTLTDSTEQIDINCTLDELNSTVIDVSKYDTIEEIRIAWTVYDEESWCCILNSALIVIE